MLPLCQCFLLCSGQEAATRWANPSLTTSQLHFSMPRGTRDQKMKQQEWLEKGGQLPRTPAPVWRRHRRRLWQRNSRRLCAATLWQRSSRRIREHMGSLDNSEGGRGGGVGLNPTPPWGACTCECRRWRAHAQVHMAHTNEHDIHKLYESI